MKYAFIVLIVIYLFTYGCIQDKEEQQSTSHEVSHTESADTHPEKAAAAQAHDTGHQEPAAAETAKAEQPLSTYEQVAQSAGNTIKALIDGNDSEEAHVATAAAAEEVQPAAQKKEAVATAKVEDKVVEEAQDTAEVKTEVVEEAQAPVTVEKTDVVVEEKHAPAAEEAPQAEVLPPCKRDEAAKEAAAPCVKPCPAAQTQIEEPQGSPTEEELKAAMSKLVKATNDMVQITRQLVVATHQMLVATKGAVVEMVDTGKEVVEAKEAEKPAEGAEKKDLIKKVENMAEATQEVLEASKEAISTAVEAQKQ